MTAHRAFMRILDLGLDLAFAVALFGALVREIVLQQLRAGKE